MNTIVDDNDEAMRSGLDAPREIKVGKLNLVDLAGSERIKLTGASG
jgi:hypothetical protein